MPRSFQTFSQEHLITAVIGLAIVAAFLIAGKKGGESRRMATTLLIFLNLSSFPLSLLAWLTLDAPKSLDNFLPLHLCDIATFTAGFALLTKRPLLCAMTYFWGLAATFQALLTPAISVGFPHFPFVMFFIQHFAIVATALYLPIVIGWRPRQPLWKGPLEIFVWSVIYLIFAMAVNYGLGTNFGFASRPPDNPSLIDHLGPWPWYLFSMQAIAVVFFLLLALPFARRSGSRQPANEDNK
ncbi:MAG: TIGR02206 family membrane protein, partial [Akkermansiaceae bacterium]